MTLPCFLQNRAYADDRDQVGPVSSRCGASDSIPSPVFGNVTFRQCQRTRASLRDVFRLLQPRVAFGLLRMMALLANATSRQILRTAQVDPAGRPLARPVQTGQILPSFSVAATAGAQNTCATPSMSPLKRGDNRGWLQISIPNEFVLQAVRGAVVGRRRGGV